MKYLLPVLIIILIAGFLLRETYFTLNIHDTYYVTSYLYIAVLLVVFFTLIFLCRLLLKKLRQR